MTSNSANLPVQLIFRIVLFFVTAVSKADTPRFEPAANFRFETSEQPINTSNCSKMRVFSQSGQQQSYFWQRSEQKTVLRHLFCLSEFCPNQEKRYMVMQNGDYSGDLPNSIHLLAGATRDEIASLLMNVPLFDNLDAKDLTILSRYVKLYSAPQGSELFNEGGTGDFMAIVVDELIADTESGSCGAGPLFTNPDEMEEVSLGTGLFHQRMQSLGASFAKPLKVLVLTRQSMDLMVVEHKQTAINLLWKLCQILCHQPPADTSREAKSRFDF